MVALSIKAWVLYAGSGGAPCGDCGTTRATRIADGTGTICLGCIDRRLRGQGGTEGRFRVHFQCPMCGKELNNLPLHLWRKVYERRGICLDCLN